MKKPIARVCLALSLSAAGCADGDTELLPVSEPKWQQIEESAAAALLSVHGTAADDVWMAGADDGKGPLVLHWNGRGEWQRMPTGVQGDLWWVHATEQGPVYFGGSEAHILRYAAGAFERMPTPGLGKHTIYGIWAASPTDVYAVGSVAGRNGFIWHYAGERWAELALPEALPQNEQRDLPGLFKVWGASANDVWVVGGRGVVLRGNASEGFQLVQHDDASTLFTVHAARDRVVVVGGEGKGQLLVASGDKLVDASPAAAPLLQGACVSDTGDVWAVGVGGSIYHDAGEGFQAIDAGIDFKATQSLHSAWVDPHGGVWAAGGNVLTPELDAGIAIHRPAAKGVAAVTSFRLAPLTPPGPSCPEAAIDPEPTASIARRWNEQILGAIRRDIPRPTVHARNLFHLSLAMWDAWAAYDALADGYLSDERLSAEDSEAARAEAISFAAYRILSHRYAGATGGATSKACFEAFMSKLGYDASDENAEGDAPSALGNRIARTVIAAFAGDGANEQGKYAPLEGYHSENANLVVDLPGTTLQQPTLWQKLVLAKSVTQNGIPAGSGAQDYIGVQWGQVTPFALLRPSANEAYLDLGTPPVALDENLARAALDILRRSSELDIADGVMMDISPGAYGNNPLGSNDGSGHPLNPATGKPYAPKRVKRGDFTRVLAEFWSDGPASETPPGHWNTLANHVTEHPEFSRRLFGDGPELSPLAWDVHAYLVMNGAVHDAAIAAWELKRKYESARPISLIRHMGGLGQRSDRKAPAYHPDGLPLVPDLIEVISHASSAAGERHAHLRRYVGELAVRSWRGEPGDREREVGGVGWLRAKDWIPYQRRTFVTPAFPGYVSGHSTFSRAAAEVLAELTGSAYFPGGLGSYTFEPGYLFFEEGPSEVIELQWATYFDAADQAGQSRLWGGIHIPIDDLDGRRIGAEVGKRALARAQSYFDGSAR